MKMKQNGEIKQVKLYGDNLNTNIIGSAYWGNSRDDIYKRFLTGCEPDGVKFVSRLLKYMCEGSISILINEDSLSNQRVYNMYALYKDMNNPDGRMNINSSWKKVSDLGMERVDCENVSLVHDCSTQDLIIIDDKNLCFRRQMNSQTLMVNDTWTLINTKFPLIQGQFWDTYPIANSNRTVLVIDVDQIRKASIQVSKRLSWERTALDLIWGITYNPTINILSSFPYVIVYLGLEGAILFENVRASNKIYATLFFDPKSLEGDGNNRLGGKLEKIGECILSTMAYEILYDQDGPDFSRGIQSGMNLARFLNYNGLIFKNGVLTYPYKDLAETAIKNEEVFASVLVKDPNITKLQLGGAHNANNDWAIINDTEKEDLMEISKRIVVNGVEHALKKVPLGKFGAKMTFDRFEIEQLNSISQVLNEYVKTKQRKPLNIAVFGSPGSGKSFAVEQIGKSVIKNVEIMTFNVAQFISTQDLITSFHQIRDVALSGKLPFVFWDEFDSNFGEKKLGWLQYFLSPMQDGSFRDGNLIHPIGKSVFVFAGGICSTFKEFSAHTDDNFAMNIKLPDFISRLKGTIDIAGPNREKRDDSDQFFILRRAMVLRSLLERGYPNIFIEQEGIKKANIDNGVINAFLGVRNFHHGARSMESILSMSTLAGSNHFKKSDLPAESQLNIHVNADEFMGIVNGIELEGEKLETLAEGVHKIFCKKMESEGYEWGPETCNENKTHRLLMPYHLLSEEDKQQNRLNAIDMPKKLLDLGYVMLPAKDVCETIKFSDNEIETLARKEHERWLESKQNQGWVKGEKTNHLRKIHSSMVPWDSLSELDKDKGRSLVRDIPSLLSESGFIVKKIIS